MTQPFDVLVVGARCAGATTALHYARQGRRVLLVDRARLGSDTLSTHALMRAGVQALVQLGVEPTLRARGTPVVRHTTIHYGREAPIEVDIVPKHGVQGLLAPRRTVLDRVLVEAAVDAGVEVRFGTSLHAVTHEDHGRVNGAVLHCRGVRETVRARLVVGADGRRSTVAEQVGARTLLQSPRGTSNAYAYVSGLPQDTYEWTYDAAASSGIIPTNEGLACVFVCGAPKNVQSRLAADPVKGWQQLLRRAHPDVAERVFAGHRETPVYRFSGAVGHLKQAAGPGWALVGDAGYFKDPLTAHGITDALRDAALLASATDARGEVGPSYAECRDTLARPFLAITDALARHDWDLERVQCLHQALHDEMKRERSWLLAQAA
ncbi:MAG: NAD(P)/FAD-dependent oxidoreductase [Myxococcota bacterium]